MGTRPLVLQEVRWDLSWQRARLGDRFLSVLSGFLFLH